MPSATCPHCQTPSHMTYFPTADGRRDSLIIWLGEEMARSVGVDAIKLLARRFAVGDDSWHLGRCENCQKPVFLLLDYYYPEKVNAVYPSSRMKPHADITKREVALDYVEARLCLSVGAFKGAAVLCRRALQGAAIDKGAKKDKLVEQLDELVKTGKLTEDLGRLAHNVRQLSNYGAHPGEDGLDDLTGEEAQAVCDLTWQILDHLYVVPAKSARIGKAIQAKKARQKEVPPSKSPNP